MTLTPQLCRAARAYLGWSQSELASNASTAVSTVADFEREARDPIENNRRSMQTAFERSGIVFIVTETMIGIGHGQAAVDWAECEAMCDRLAASPGAREIIHANYIPKRLREQDQER